LQRKNATQEANLRDKIAQADTNAAQKEQKLQASLAKVDANEARRVLAISDRIARLQAQSGGSSVAAMDLGFVHTDSIGTPRKITKASDNSLLWNLSPDDPWGGSLPDASSTITYNLRFAGQYYDSETGLHNNGFRVYCPSCGGRYLQPDPLGLAGGIHRYNYTPGDPINKTDSLGLLPDPISLASTAADVAAIGADLAAGEYGAATVDVGVAGVDALLTAYSPVPGSSQAGNLLRSYRLLKKLSNAKKTAQACETAVKETKWVLGSFKSETKWTNQLQKRGWTKDQITEAIERGEQFATENLVNKGNAATRYVNPTTGQSVVIDNVTNEVLHVGGPDFKY